MVAHFDAFVRILRTERGQRIKSFLRARQESSEPPIAEDDFVEWYEFFGCEFDRCFDGA